ncbi:MAG: hypothetical protein ACLUIQ_09085 [Dialister invisus]
MSAFIYEADIFIERAMELLDLRFSENTEDLKGMVTGFEKYRCIRPFSILYISARGIYARNVYNDAGNNGQGGQRKRRMF